MNKEYYPLSNIEEIRPLLSKISVFGGLNDSQLDEIFKLLKTVKYEPGEFIYKRGEALTSIYIIRHGEVKMMLEDKNILIELISFKDGDCFGETSVIGIQSHSSNALVLKPTELIVLEPSKLLNIYETNKELFSLLILNIARETSRRLHQSNEVLIQHMLKEKNPISWEAATKEKFNQMVTKVPIFLRDIAEKKVFQKAESLAQKDGRKIVCEKDMVDAFFAETPFGFHGPMKIDMDKLGIDYLKYGYSK